MGSSGLLLAKRSDGLPLGIENLGGETPYAWLFLHIPSGLLERIAPKIHWLKNPHLWHISCISYNPISNPFILICERVEQKLHHAHFQAFPYITGHCQSICSHNNNISTDIICNWLSYSWLKHLLHWWRWPRSFSVRHIYSYNRSTSTIHWVSLSRKRVVSAQL